MTIITTIDVNVSVSLKVHYMNDNAFFVDVITTKRDNPNIIVDARKINYANSRAREWLGKHSNWALRSGLAVHTAAAMMEGV
jgi:hypothetical protein